MHNHKRCSVGFRSSTQRSSVIGFNYQTHVIHLAFARMFQYLAQMQLQDAAA